MRYFPACLLLLISNFATAQKINKTFDSVYFNAATVITASDPDEAIRIADSLYDVSVEPVNKVKSLMLKANVYQSKGSLKKSIAVATDAEVLAGKGNLVEWQARILGFLSTQYRYLGLAKKGRALLEKGILIGKSLPDKEKSNQYHGLSLQELARYYNEEEKHLEAIQVLRKADSLFQQLKNSNEKYFFLATNEEFIGEELNSLRRPAQSLPHFKNASALLKRAGAQQSELSGFIYNGMGAAFQAMKRNDSAYAYLSKALVIAQASGHPNLTPDVYGNLATYYFEVGSIREARTYSRMRDSIVTAKAKRNSGISDDIVQELSDQPHRSLPVLTWVLAVILFISAAAYYHNFRKRSTSKNTANGTGEEMSGQHPLHNAQQTNFDQVPERKPSPRQATVPAEAEERILKKLEKFERKERFTNKNITLTMISAQLETNPKYLSITINKNKGCDFNSYINGLRIAYAVRKLETDPSYLNYKLSYLAEECGFSSHSKFSSLFKNVTGMSPSDYISLKKASVIL